MQFELDDVEVETIRWALDNELDDFREEVKSYEEALEKDPGNPELIAEYQTMASALSSLTRARHALRFPIRKEANR